MKISPTRAARHSSYVVALFLFSSESPRIGVERRRRRLVATHSRPAPGALEQRDSAKRQPGRNVHTHQRTHTRTARDTRHARPDTNRFRATIRAKREMHVRDASAPRPVRDVSFCCRRDTSNVVTLSGVISCVRDPPHRGALDSALELFSFVPLTRSLGAITTREQGDAAPSRL